MATTRLEEEKLALFFEDLEETEEESEFEFDTDIPLPGLDLVRKVLLFIAKETGMQPNFIDCSHYGQDKLPEGNLEAELLPSRDDERMYLIPLRDVPPLFDRLFPNASLKIHVLPLLDPTHLQIDVDLCSYKYSLGKKHEIKSVANLSILEYFNNTLSWVK